MTEMISRPARVRAAVVSTAVLGVVLLPTGTAMAAPARACAFAGGESVAEEMLDRVTSGEPIGDVCDFPSPEPPPEPPPP
ncbi:hypothetical protein, partial [Streptomyces alkaliterrae]